ncbi:MAG: DUF5063 domain-containing protein [Bacteroidales bacterium]|nr:DUF5063 domain-containing protein [Bacteroidales bacterium]MBD5205909.1 DUF5063 domain-containing protein [Bacteroidales bacterium]MBD5222656.1 DUF5063 domain-containing protein [Bacteroidales bacterium]MBD5302033.1 DUF5063 domain-containing protein [Bacteroides sp.]MBD5348296.1 DUF5063 domain-containing protein [Bacteroides sp.]
MTENVIKSRLVNITALATDYCAAVQNAREIEKQDFVIEILGYLPRLYWEFADLVVEDVTSDIDYEYYPSYVDEDFYDSVRRGVETTMGEDDVFLETFEDDMKYSDTPIASSISECLADIFQPLYNFISVVKESDGEQMVGAYSECRENFVAYWSQTLCNVMRALNNLRFK